MNKYWKIIIPLLIALAVGLGLYQHSRDPYFGGSNTKVYSNSNSGQDELKYYYNKSQQLSQKNDTQATTTFLAVGDIMLSRSVAGTIKKAGDPLLPFSKMADIFRKVDFVFGNLESPFSGSDSFSPSGSMVFNAPTGNIQGLVDFRFRVLSLANNHALDQGVKGLNYTITYLDEKKIGHIGAGKNLSEAWRPAVVEQSGIKICFIGASYASVNDNGKTENDYVARTEDLANLKLAITSAKSQCDFTVAAMHAGTEYTRQPNAAQIAFAHAAIDDGADMVIGGHPHWAQTTEKYQGKYIFYSLGNFIFDQEWSQDTKEGLALKIQISKSKIQNPQTPGAAASDDLQGSRTPAKLESVELIPVVIENYSTPRLATAEEAKKILEKIGQINNIIEP